MEAAPGAEVATDSSREEAYPGDSQASSDGAEYTETSSGGATAVQEDQPGGIVSVKTLPDTGCVVTSYATVSKSVAPNGVKVTLHMRDLWAKFHKSTTEMIITKAGRKCSQW